MDKVQKPILFINNHRQNPSEPTCSRWQTKSRTYYSMKLPFAQMKSILKYARNGAQHINVDGHSPCDSAEKDIHKIGFIYMRLCRSLCSKISHKLKVHFWCFIMLKWFKEQSKRTH
jgi:hypothetical protein